MIINKFDIVIVGAGGAGLRAEVEIPKKTFLKIKTVIICIAAAVLFSDNINAQVVELNEKFGNYNFKTKFDSIEYTTTLTVSKEDVEIFKETYYELIPGIKEFDLDNDSNKEILVGMYSGGAHCCTSLFAGKFENGKFVYTDTIIWDNSFFRVEDLNQDGKLEIIGVNDVYAYVFTNYSQSRFPLLIYAYENEKFVKATSEFPQMVKESLNVLLNEIDEYKDFKCEEAGTETFNSDAGAVKAILAAVTEEYMSLGKIEEGYILIDEFYKCPDAEIFKEILRKDFLLK